MRRRLANLKIIDIVKSSNEKKPYVFVHPDTVDRISALKPYSIQVMLYSYQKRKDSDPDYVGRFNIIEDHFLRVGETFCFSLIVDFSSIRLLLFDRKSSPVFISSLIKKFDSNPGGSKEGILNNFFYTKIPMDFSIADYPLSRKYNHRVYSPTEFTKNAKVRVAIWKHIDHFKLKIEPAYLPFLHGSTQPA